jgi:hypothetical protein
MAKKSLKISTRTYIYIIIVILIALGTYLIITNLPETKEYLTPQEININKENYIGDTVTIIGEFDYFGADPIVLTTSLALEENSYLKLDLSLLEDTNATDDLFQGEKYYFTGQIAREYPDNPLLFDKIVLILDNFEKV